MRKINEYAIWARAHGKCPDWAWYQMDNRPVDEKFQKQRQKILEQLQEEPPAEIHITSEVKFT